MKPPCDPTCESRRFWWYIIYLCILVGCVGLALCHFLFNLAIRRRIKQDARDYYANRPPRSVPVYTTTGSEQIHHFSSFQDGIKISTDAMSDLVIEMTNGHPSHNLSSLSSITMEGYGQNYNYSQNHDHRPLQKTPPEESQQDKDVRNKIVEVEVHMDNGLPVQTLQPYRQAVVTSPVTVAVATVSAQVAEQVHHNPAKDMFGSISRPSSSSPSYFDISDIVNSPDAVRKVYKSKTC